MEKPGFTGANIFDVRVVRVIMRAPVMELLC
jgi:hypothetical protein